MISTLLVVLLLSQTERPDNPPDGAMEPPLPATSAERLHYLASLEVAGLALLPSDGVEGVKRYASSVGLEVEHAR